MQLHELKELLTVHELKIRNEPTDTEHVRWQQFTVLWTQAC